MYRLRKVVAFLKISGLGKSRRKTSVVKIADRSLSVLTAIFQVDLGYQNGF